MERGAMLISQRMVGMGNVLAMAKLRPLNPPSRQRSDIRVVLVVTRNQAFTKRKLSVQIGAFGSAGAIFSRWSVSGPLTRT